jgi:hypothetical protein
VITKDFHDDGVTPAERLHPDDYATLEEIRDALVAIADCLAEMKNAPKTKKRVQIIRDAAKGIVGADVIEEPGE